MLAFIRGKPIETKYSRHKSYRRSRFSGNSKPVHPLKTKNQLNDGVDADVEENLGAGDNVDLSKIGSLNCDREHEEAGSDVET